MPRTAWTAEAARQGRGTLLVSDGYGHSGRFLGYHDCIHDEVDAYLLTGATTPSATHCANKENP